MKKNSRLYIALSVVYVAMTIVFLASHFMPGVSDLAFSSILEDAQLQGVAMVGQGQPSSASEITITANKLEGVASGQLDYYSWMVVVLLLGGQLLLAYGVIYHREWATRLMVLILVASLSHMLPYASAQLIQMDEPIVQQEASIIK